MLDHSPESWSYEDLYIEHAPAARRLALTLVPADVADDIVAEAFARVLAAIRAGGGPSHAFRGYLLTSVRHLAHDWLRARRRLTVVDDLDVQATDAAAGSGRVSPGIGAAAETQAEARDEARLVTRAFGRLPARWREVLWQLEVEGKAPAAVAPMFGLSANGVSALAVRAREGLRQAYLEEHVGANVPAACRTYAAEFGAGARGRLSQRRRAAMQEHLGHCPACQDLFTELTELNSRLGAILTPVALAAAARALGSAKRATILRTSLTGHWRAWRWHPVTSVTGAAAGVAVVGGMLLAVNVTPVTSTPAHAATAPAIPAAVPGSAAPGKRHPAGGGSGRGGSGGTAARAAAHSPAGPGSLSVSGSPASTGSLASTDSPASTSYLTALVHPAGPGSPAVPPRSVATTGLPAPAAPASPRQASQTPSNGGTTIPSTPATPRQPITGTVTSLASTATITVTGLVNNAGTTAASVTSTASGLVNTATATVTSVTSEATSAVTGVADTTSATVATTGETVANTVTGAASTVTSTANKTTGAVTGAASTATSTATGAASTATNAVTGTVSTAVTTTAQTVAAAASSGVTKAVTPSSSTNATSASIDTTVGAAVGEVTAPAAGLVNNGT